MKQFFSFVRKEFYHILRDKQTMVILLLMPIIQILLFGFAITTELNNARVAVFDLAHDNESMKLVQHFEASKYFDVVKTVHTPAEIDEAFKRGEISLAVVIPEGFGQRMYQEQGSNVQLIADGSEPNQANMLTAYSRGIITSYQQGLARQSLGSAIVINPVMRMLYNPQGKSAFNFVPGVMGLIFILICAMMTSISIVKEKETGTMEILLSSPMKPIYVILAKSVPYLALSLVNLATILLLAVFVLDVPIAGSLLGLIALSMIYIFLALSLGLLISSYVDTQKAALLGSGMGLMMPMMLLSGMMFPIESLPTALRAISYVVPARWYIEGVKKIMIQGVDLVHVQTEFIVLGAMAAFFILLSLKSFKTRL